MEFCAEYIRKWRFFANKVWSAFNFKHFQNNPILKSRDYTNPLTSELWKLTLPPGRWYVRFFFDNMREKDELKGTWSNFTTWLRIWAPGQKLLGVASPPLEY